MKFGRKSSFKGVWIPSRSVINSIYKNEESLKTVTFLKWRDVFVEEIRSEGRNGIFLNIYSFQGDIAWPPSLTYRMNKAVMCSYMISDTCFVKKNTEIQMLGFCGAI